MTFLSVCALCVVNALHSTLVRRGVGVVYRYDFEAYTEASEKMYRVFLRYAPVVMAVSCDEAFLELAEGTDPMEATTQVRRPEDLPPSALVGSPFGGSICTPSECCTACLRLCTLHFVVRFLTVDFPP